MLRLPTTTIRNRVLLMTASRARWLAVWVLIALWLVALAFNLGGNLAHLLLLFGLALLVYELLAEEPETS